MIPEDRLVEQLNEKQVVAFHELFNRFYRYLVIYAMKRVGRQEIAEDIVQDLFIKVWENDTVYTSYYGFKNFLYNSVKNAAFDYMKHKVVEGKYIQYSSRNPEDDTDMELELMRQEIYRRLYLVIEELPKRCGEVFRLHLQGKKNAEIAAMLQISELTVKAQKTHALRYIEKRLGDLYIVLLIFKMI